MGTTKTADWGYVRLHGYRPKSVTKGLGLRPMLYTGPVCDDSAAEAAYAAKVALKLTF